MMDGKECRTCHEVKPLSEFWNNKRYKDGLNYECKACASARQKAWRKANPQACLMYSRRDYMLNYEARRAQKREYYLAHREELLEKSREYARKNRDELNRRQRVKYQAVKFQRKLKRVQKQMEAL